MLIVSSPGMSENNRNYTDITQICPASGMNISTTNTNATQGLQYDNLQQIFTYSDNSVLIIAGTADIICNEVDLFTPDPLYGTYNNYFISNLANLRTYIYLTEKMLLVRKTLITNATNNKLNKTISNSINNLHFINRMTYSL